MTFANPLPTWGLVLAAVASAVVAWNAYRSAPLPARRRASLSFLRFALFGWLILCLMRPIGAARADAGDAVVPILIDASRSMGLAGVDGGPRINEARRIAGRLLQSRGGPRRDVLSFGETVSSADLAKLTAAQPRTRIGDALTAVRERYRGQPIAGIVLLSDGADNGGVDPQRAAEDGPPILAVPVGPAAVRDRELLGVTAAETLLDGASVDVTATAVAHGYGADPIALRLLENGRPLEVRSVRPAAEDVPVSAVFTVAPKRDAATVYTVEIPPASDELSFENNARSALVPAARPPLRVLLMQGAPGFDHAFLRRALTTDPAIQLDSVVRKGKDDHGADTFYVQASAVRANALLGGMPSAREPLFAYDVIVLANVDPDELTTTQTDLLRAFVTERGGGLLVLGARGLQGPALRGTALEAVLPLDPGDRASGIVTASNVSPSLNRVTLTAAGEAHPVMQIGDSPEETRKRWAAVPSLASVAPLGAARPGSAVLAVTAGPGGVPRALVAVQRTGQGRAMVFTGEASWRWRMMLPASDRSYDRFWRQAVRWLGQHAPSAVSVTVPASAAPGDVPIDVFARDGGFLPRSDAVVDVEVRTPAGDSRSLRAELSSAQPGHYVATLHAGERGIYRLTATAARGAVGAASASMLIGSADPEFTDPRVDAGALARIARASGGAVVTAAELPGLVDRLRSSQPATALRERHDLWSEPWSFAVMAVLLPTEWLTRRRWGLR